MGRSYENAKKLLTAEINAAVEGMLEMGVDDILVCDGHGPGAVVFEELHSAAKLLHPSCSTPGEHGCWWKSNYYEGSAGVPLLFRLPDLIETSSTCDAVCGLIDLGVTFTDMAEGDFKPVPDGRSLWQTLNGRRPESWEDKTFSELVDVRNALTPSRMIRYGKWKLWLTAEGENPRPVLFNPEDNPDELCDLGQYPHQAEIRKKLLKELYENWVSTHIRTMAKDNSESYKTISSWGNAVNPTHPDSVTVTTAEYEPLFFV